MKISQIVTQLATTLPTVTTLFSDTVNIISLTRAGTTVTAITQVAHELTTSSSVVIQGAKSPTTIDTITSSGSIATATTSTPHDLTEGWQGQVPSDSPTVEITGSDKEVYNGVHNLLSVPNRETFTYQVDSATDPSSGITVLLEDKLTGYNGTHEITVVDTITFTYEITETPESPSQGLPIVYKGIRVFGAATSAEAHKAYTAQTGDNLWAGVLLGGATALTDPNVIVGTTAIFTSGADFIQKVNTPFTVLIFVTSTNGVYGREPRDLMEDVRPYLLKSLLGKKFDTELSKTSSTGVIYEGDDIYAYDGALYIHQFIFSSISDITLDDTIQETDNVAFRDIALSYLDDEGTVELTSDINLDDQPTT